jgi:hypothetical protein
MSDSDTSQWADAFSAGKGAVEFLKSLLSLVPEGEREKGEEEIKKIERVLAFKEAATAKSLGYKLCTCTVPPQIMLWNEQRKVHVCTNADCGRTFPPQRPEATRGEGSWVRSRRGH